MAKGNSDTKEKIINEVTEPTDGVKETDESKEVVESKAEEETTKISNEDAQELPKQDTKSKESKTAKNKPKESDKESDNAADTSDKAADTQDKESDIVDDLTKVEAPSKLEAGQKISAPYKLYKSVDDKLGKMVYNKPVYVWSSAAIGGKIRVTDSRSTVGKPWKVTGFIDLM